MYELDPYKNICGYCNWWQFGCCSDPGILSQLLQDTGELKTYVLRRATDTCTSDSWLLKEMRYIERAGSRQQFSAPSSVATVVSTKPDVYDQLDLPLLGLNGSSEDNSAIEGAATSCDSGKDEKSVLEGGGCGN